ncbi:iron chelate uptake ABC transporter family permease subunit [Nisaea sp.]|uniref:iron chelate uptake ABC transporter family permease subunit n=1 Tax=Nisaea sp. TaxID=2024842 RepID=UPI003266DD89
MGSNAKRIWTPALALMLLAGLACLSVALFMTVGVKGNWGFVLPFRGLKIATMALVGYAIAVSTVLFHTVTANRILTPSIMGFDALFILIQTSIAFFFGAMFLTGLPPGLLFLIQTATMTVFAGLLFNWLFRGGVRELHLMLLSGIIFGLLFRSLSSFFRRVIDPDEFLILQDTLFASFNRANPELLSVAATLVLLVSLAAWRLRNVFDVMALGRETAVNLGVNHRRMVTVTLAMVTVLVSVSTALVGPVTFFGLLVANLAYMLVPSHRHILVLPGAAFLAVTCLVGGQLFLERVLSYGSALSIVIEFAGGIVFIMMIVMRGAR